MTSVKAKQVLDLYKGAQENNATVGVYAWNRYVFDNDLTPLAQQWQFKSLKTIQKELISCNCSENFEFIKHREETSYSGFQDKVNPNFGR